MRKCTIEELRARMAAGAQCEWLDVREAAEYAAERIAGTRHAPLSQWPQAAAQLDPATPVYLICRSGNRAAQAAQQLQQRGHAEICVVEGGLQAWRAAGFPVELGTSRVWSMERQVRCAAGALVVLGVLLDLLVHPWLSGLAGFVGAGLVFSAVTDTCGMALVLARLPWNQRADAACARV